MTSIDVPSTSPMTVDLLGRTAVVTGGGTGIGCAVSRGLARCGAAVVVNYSKSENDAKETVEAIRHAGGQAVAARADVTNEHQVEGLMRKTLDTFGSLDIVVANAGRPTGSYLTNKLTDERWREGLDLNCTATFYSVKHAMDHLPNDHGRIIITGTMSVRTGGISGALTYVAGKDALESMVRCWAREFGPRGITVNVVAPGTIRTRLYDWDKSPESYQSAIVHLAVWANPKTVSDCTCCWLAMREVLSAVR